MVKIIIDTRENEKFYKILKRVCKNIIIIKKQLDIGDIIIENNNDDNNNKKIVIERKTIADLESSIKDGRKKEQCFRLRKIVKYPRYLVEGKINLQRRKMGHAILQSITNVQTRDCIPVIRTPTMLASAHEIFRIAKCVQKNGIDIDTERVDSIEQVYKYKTKRKGGCTSDNDLYKVFLRVMPNIGPKLQTAIYEKYPSFATLVDICKNNPDELYEIKYGKRKTKIPKKIVKSLIKFICDK